MKSLLKVKGVGESANPPLFFVHGAWHGAWCWKPLMDYLAQKGFTSYAIDLPGHGNRKSENVAGLGIMDYVSEVESSIQELALVKPILIGHSMGGLIVQKFLEKNDALSSVIIAPCPAMGGSLFLPIKYFCHAPKAGIAATFGRKTAIKNEEMCQRLFFNDIQKKELESHFQKLGPESAKAIRQMVIPFFKLKAAKISSTPVAVAAAGNDYFFEFKRLHDWAIKYGYDFLPFPEAAHNLINKPDDFDFGKTIYEWIQ